MPPLWSNQDGEWCAASPYVLSNFRMAMKNPAILEKCRNHYVQGHHRGINMLSCTIKKNPAAVALGKLGGAKKTLAKQKASRLNGKKGGRPRTTPHK